MEVPGWSPRDHAVHLEHLGWRNENNHYGTCRCQAEVRERCMKVASRNEVSQVLRAEKKTIGLDWIGEKRRGCTTASWRHNVMGAHDQMTSARLSTSPRHRQSHRVSAEGLQRARCSAMMMNDGCAQGWSQRLRQ